jgi:hypothetical protein
MGRYAAGLGAVQWIIEYVLCAVNGLQQCLGLPDVGLVGLDFDGLLAHECRSSILRVSTGLG